jgi:general secretion pathway protein D
MIPRFALLCLAAGFAVSASNLSAQAQLGRAPAQPASMPLPGRGSDQIVPYFKLPEGDIDSMLGALEIYTGRTVLRPGSLPAATYSLVINRPIPRSELVLALETELSLNQIGVIPLGDRFLKVVPLSTAKAEAPEFISGSTLDMAPSGRIATKLYQLDFLRAPEFFNSGLTSIFSPGVGGGIVVLEKANAALVTDTISNLQRIETLVKSLDHPTTGNLTPRFYPLHSAKASDLVTKLHSILSGPIQSQLGSATTFNADDRTNQVIVLADDREQPFFEELITKLDGKADPNTRNEVIFLQHADAKDVATLLQQVVSGQNSAAQKTSSQSVRPGDITTANQQNGNAAAAVSQGAGTNAEFSSLVTVLPDERSNSIVVSGTVDDIRLIRELVDKIDEVLPQVRIQVIIAEVTLDDTDASGITALGLTVGPKGGVAGAPTQITTFAGSGSSTTGTSGTGTSTSLIPGTSIAGWDFTSGIVNPLSFAAAFNPSSAGSKNIVKVLSAPVIVTAHNKQAEVIVGEQLPIITGSQSTPVSGGTATSSGFSTNSTVTYQTIAIDLKVTPLIGENGDVQMTIDQKVNDIVGETTIDQNQQPIIGNREATSFVTVKDGEMIVLGGMQRTQKSENHNKIGFLYEIPIISELLGGNTDELQRTELLFFIRPHVVTPEESTHDTMKHIKELSNKEQIEQFLKDPGNVPNSKAQNFLDRFKSD